MSALSEDDGNKIPAGIKLSHLSEIVSSLLSLKCDRNSSRNTLSSPLHESIVREAVSLAEIGGLDPSDNLNSKRSRHDIMSEHDCQQYLASCAYDGVEYHKLPSKLPSIDALKVSYESASNKKLKRLHLLPEISSSYNTGKCITSRTLELLPSPHIQTLQRVKVEHIHNQGNSVSEPGTAMKETAES
mmetsp:Transcript_9579/g.14422  ORF Transcript_9579/g.14422 Transcript_9579/m.14422 type:complete len:187 (-) Transcript_9579:361-921(-)|eukprot:CAMPEP_0185025562 /NCGR_PEP_ID=MMETSP1103-20130426/8468_1 /TAXON_ID=36769 /ORGANISM="Paraphysomonas bandaiensis, Strain Caron Lab Isolate" /LENGTH=186 /DNA_ID=CAMNT_0027558783 /DNA_START=122 /DNA_END=682 /DNA_ORIENTATION=-